MTNWQQAAAPHLGQLSKPFAKIFDALGVDIDMSRSTSNEVIVRNKSSRLEAMELQVAEIVAQGVCSQARANS